MGISMCLNVEFNRPVDTEKDYIVAGGFSMIMNGKEIEFDFHMQQYFVDSDNPACVSFELYNPDYECFADFKKVTVNDLKHISEINECFVYTGEDSDLQVISVDCITFRVVDSKATTVKVKPYILTMYNYSGGTTRIEPAAFTSVWDGCAVTTPCKINTETGEVFDIEISHVDISGTLEREYITLHGTEHEVHGNEDVENVPGEYWYGAEKAYYYGRDPQDRPVYTFEDGRFVKDVSATWPTASLCYATNNKISGEPDEAVTVAVKLLPQRMT